MSDLSWLIFESQTIETKPKAHHHERVIAYLQDTSPIDLDVIEMSQTKVCSYCGTEKDKSEFYTHPHTTDGLDGRCITCIKLISKQRYNANRQERMLQIFNNKKLRYGQYREYSWLRQGIILKYITFLQKITEQHHECAICGCHSDDRAKSFIPLLSATGELVSVVCNSCNISLRKKDVSSAFEQNRAKILQSLNISNEVSR